MKRLLVMTLVLTLFPATFLRAEDVCDKQNKGLQKDVTVKFLKNIKAATLKELILLYEKNKLSPVKSIQFIGQNSRGLIYKIQAGKDSIDVTVKLREAIKVSFWQQKPAVDALGRTKNPKGHCVARAYVFSTSQEKVFLDIENTSTRAPIASISVVNLAELHF